MLFVDFISWWYADGFNGFLKRLGLQLAKITDFFSVGLLIKTLDKLIARFIGGLIRSTVLIFAIIVIFTTITIDLLKIALWLSAPLLPIIGAVLLAMGVTL